jgi:tyrosyl-DNA phosphodiesterase-1
MIAGDWANMTQAVWRSPLLPLSSADSSRGGSNNTPTLIPWDYGARFKRDILAYLKEYGVKKTGPLVDQLAMYDFSAIRAVLIASVPSKLKIGNSGSSGSDERTIWGWPALRDALRHVPLRESDATPHIIAQV